MQDTLSLHELNALVRRSLEQCLPDEYWVQAELSDVRTNSTGHCYLEFVQKDPRSNNLIAKARGTIWANIYRLLKPYFEEATGQSFTSGIKVLVKVTVAFHELYGYSLTVQDIDPTYTLGDMARRRREILKQLAEEGVLTLNKELEMPLLPQRIAVISSATAAGYGDFCHQLQHNSRGFYFNTELFPALMQGNQVEESVLAALDAVNARMEEAADRLEELAGELHARIYHRLEQERKRLSLLQSRIPSQVMRKLSESRIKLQMAKSNLSHAAETLLARQHHRLELLQNRIADASPQKLLKRGYSITLKEGKAVKNAACLRPGDELITRLYEGEVKSKVESIPL